MQTRRDVLKLFGVAAAGGLAACAPAAPGSTPASGVQPTASAPATVTIANEVEPPDLLPYANGFGGWLIDRQIYEPLFDMRMSVNAQGVGEVAWIPRLALSYERVDPLRWRFKLRPNVQFHNGEPFTAQSIKAAFDVLADRQLAARLKKSSILASSYAGAEVVDDLTVDILTPTPNAEALSFLRISLVALPPKLLAEKGVEAFAEKPVGTGRYQMASWSRGQEIRLSRFAGYWGTKAPVETLRFIARPDAAVRAQTVRGGEALFAYNVGSEQAAGGNALVGGGFQSSGIRLNNAHPVTGDVRVRRALNLAIDRAAIARTIFRGTAVPIAFFAFQPVKLEPYGYKPDEARKLIDEAGARGATLELVYGETRIPEEDQLAEVYKAAFEAIGLKVTLRKVEPVQYNEIGARPFADQPPLYMETTSSGNYGEVGNSLRDKYGCAGTGTFCNPDLDKQYTELAALDGDVRLSRLQQIADRLHTQEVSRVWVVAVRQVHLAGPNVKANLPANAYLLLDDLTFA